VRQTAGIAPVSARCPARTVAAVRKRDVVDHALARRALLRSLYGGGLFTTTSAYDVCDASPFLTRAAEAYGTQSDRACPICRKDRLWEVAWVYGDALGPYSGSARSQAQLERLEREFPDFAVYEVEVCRRCAWNHLVRSYRLGTPGTEPSRAPPRRRGNE
jgi:hypothetical protein